MGVGVMVGREREVEVLLAALETLRAGRGGLLLVTGEPGIGKTRLCDELSARASATGARVVWGAAWDGGGAPAYWPWIQVLRELRPFLPAPDERLRRELGPLWDEAALLDPLGHTEAGMADLELARFRRFDALRSLLASASTSAPLVVMLDDLHAADRASLLALQFVAGMLRALPILIVGTHREAEARADPELQGLLARIARHGTTLPLSRLGREEVARLLDKLDVTDRVVDQVYQTSGGNPLFVGETVRFLRTGGPPGAIPDGVKPVIRDRLARFEAPTRAALEAAAVLGRETEWGLLADTSGLSIEALREALQPSRLAGILEELGQERLRFTHALYRETLYEDLAPPARSDLHLRAGQALERGRAAGRDVTAEAVAHHLVAALPAGDAGLALDWAVSAGQAAIDALAFDRAVLLLEGALAALDRLPPDPRRRIDVSLCLSEALVSTGAGERSRALCVIAADQARALGDGERLARAALAHGAELRLAVVDQRLVSLLGEALVMLGNEDAPLRARAMARLAAAQQPSPEPAGPVREALEAIAIARRIGHADTLLATLFAAGSALQDYAHPEVRLPLSRELVGLALPRGDLARAQQGYARVAIDCFELYDMAGADAAVTAHGRLGEVLGHARWKWRGHLLRAMRLLIAGRWDEAEQAREAAAALGHLADDPNAAMALAVQRLAAFRLREAGSAEDAAALWDPVVDAIEYGSFIADLVRASTAARIGDLAVARRLLASFPPEHPILANDPLARVLVADAVIACADRAWAPRVLGWLRGHGSHAISWGVFAMVWEGPASAWIGALESVLGHWDEAVTQLEDALAIAHDVGARPLAARVSAQLAEALLGRCDLRDRPRVDALLASAAADADALGMTNLAARIAARDARPAPAPAPAPSFSLIREGEVWSIACDEGTTRLKHSRALEILEVLVRQPGRELHVLDLGALEPIDTGDAGEAIDQTAKEAYRRRIAELEEEISEAAEWADIARRERLQAELELLKEELVRSVGLGGRTRRVGAAVERARVNVQKRLRGVTRKIGQSLPRLASHLETHIKTGTYVSYRP